MECSLTFLHRFLGSFPLHRCRLDDGVEIDPAELSALTPQEQEAEDFLDARGIVRIHERPLQDLWTMPLDKIQDIPAELSVALNIMRQCWSLLVQRGTFSYAGELSVTAALVKG